MGLLLLLGLLMPAYAYGENMKKIKIISLSGFEDYSDAYSNFSTLLNAYPADVLLTSEAYIRGEARVTCSQENENCTLDASNNGYLFMIRSLAVEKQANLIISTNNITVNGVLRTNPYGTPMSGLLFINKSGNIPFVDYLGSTLDGVWNKSVGTLENDVGESFSFASPICAEGYMDYLIIQQFGGRNLDLFFHPRYSSGYTCLDEMHLVQQGDYDAITGSFFYQYRQSLVTNHILQDEGVFTLADAPAQIDPLHPRDITCSLVNESNSPLNFLIENVDNTLGGYIYFEANVTEYVPPVTTTTTSTTTTTTSTTTTTTTTTTSTTTTTTSTTTTTTTTTTSTTTTQVPNSCSDSDYGANIYVSGYVQGYYNGNPYTYSDSCDSRGKKVYEKVCNGMVYTTQTISCPTGYKCKNGACTR
jgi:hypothetical protein